MHTISYGFHQRTAGRSGHASGPKGKCRHEVSRVDNIAASWNRRFMPLRGHAWSARRRPRRVATYAQAPSADSASPQKASDALQDRPSVDRICEKYAGTVKAASGEFRSGACRARRRLSAKRLVMNEGQNNYQIATYDVFRHAASYQFGCRHHHDA